MSKATKHRRKQNTIMENLFEKLESLSLNDFFTVECENIEEFAIDAPVGSCWADNENCWFRKCEINDEIVVWYVDRKGNFKVL